MVIAGKLTGDCVSSPVSFNGRGLSLNTRGGLNSGRQNEDIGLAGKCARRDSLIALNKAINRDICLVISRQPGVVPKNSGFNWTNYSPTFHAAMDTVSVVKMATTPLDS
jgi:hypothetical protein